MTRNSIVFICPDCRETFEFDPVGEYQLVSCPICGVEFMTVCRGQRLLLEPFELNQKSQDALDDDAPLLEVR